MILDYFTWAICRFFIYLSAVTIINHSRHWLGPRKPILAYRAIRLNGTGGFIWKWCVSMKQVRLNIFLTPFHLPTPVAQKLEAASESVRLLLLKWFISSFAVEETKFREVT